MSRLTATEVLVAFGLATLGVAGVLYFMPSTRRRLLSVEALAQLTVSDVASKLGLSNVPGGKERQNLAKLKARVIDPVQRAYPDVIVTSAFRSPEVNRAVGGVSSSHHMTGEAADLFSPSMGAEELAGRIRALGIAYDQLIWYPEKGHVHVSYREGENRGQFFRNRG